MPDALRYLHTWFEELSRSRTVGMNGPDPITYPLVDAWSRLTDRRPDPHEIEALFILDAAWRSSAMEGSK